MSMCVPPVQFEHELSPAVPPYVPRERESIV